MAKDYINFRSLLLLHYQCWNIKAFCVVYQNITVFYLYNICSCLLGKSENIILHCYVTNNAPSKITCHNRWFLSHRWANTRPRDGCTTLPLVNASFSKTGPQSHLIYYLWSHVIVLCIDFKNSSISSYYIILYSFLY